MTPEIFGFIALASGLWFVVHEQCTAQKLRSAVHWPFVWGEILSSRVKRSGGKRAVYRAKIKYRYHVGGVDHESKNIVLGGEVNGSEKRADDRVQKYPQGTPQKIYYNPAEPSEACLEIGHEGRVFGTIVGAAGVMMGCVLIFGLYPQV